MLIAVATWPTLSEYRAAWPNLTEMERRYVFQLERAQEEGDRNLH